MNGRRWLRLERLCLLRLLLLWRRHLSPLNELLLLLLLRLLRSDAPGSPRGCSGYVHAVCRRLELKDELAMGGQTARSAGKGPLRSLLLL